MRLAVIDCGTNTFNLLIVDTLHRSSYKKVFNTRIPVKLGEGAINSGYIAPEPFKRGIDAIKTFNNYLTHHQVEKVMAFATSAIRDASNGREFVEEVKKHSGIHVEIIDGNREAELIYQGNREAVPLNEEPSVIMDIGGGSTEFIIANKNQVFWKHSYNLGAARLLEKFTPSNPITSAEVEAINSYLKTELIDLYQAVEKFKPCELVGSSGAFDSVIEMINGELGGEAITEGKIAYSINLNNYSTISARIKASTLNERKQIKGLTPMRFDMIVISCLLIDFALSQFNLQQMRVSLYSLKEGALIDFINSREVN